MTKWAMATCPGCDTTNNINLDKYPANQKFGLYDVCDKCDEVYGFDIEYTASLVAYPVTNNKLQ